MASEIETALSGEWANRVSAEGHVGEHCLVEFSVRRNPPADCSDIVRIGVVPESREYTIPTIATFADAHLGSVNQVDYDPEFNYLPWGIVGFHCRDCGDDKWSFQLNCDSLRVNWSSSWPTIERGG
jgi:hypothetical protein